MQVTGNNTNQAYNLSIRLCADGFSFYVSNPHKPDIVKQEVFHKRNEENLTDKLKQALYSSSLLNENFEAVYGLICSPTTRLPLEGFKKEETEALYRLTFSDTSKEKVRYNILPHLELVELFSIHKEMEELLIQRFPSIRFISQTSAVFDLLVKYHQKSTSGNQLFIYFHDNQMEIVQFKNSKLFYANLFPCLSVQDIVYYTLYVWKALELEQEKDECMLVGSVPFKEDFIGELKNYLRKVYLLPPNVVFRRTVFAQGADMPFDLQAFLLNNI